MKPGYEGAFNVENLFIGATDHIKGLQWGSGDFVPLHLNRICAWLENREVNKYCIVVTPPDEYGYMNRSSFAGFVHPRHLEHADAVLVEVNNNTPWLCSDQFKIHVSQCSAIVENHVPMMQIPEIPVTPVEELIARNIVDMVPDGATIQLGLGGLATCIGHFLKDKKDLGVHSEVVSNSIMELIKCGAVNGSKKTLHPGKVIYTFCVGTKELWDFMDHNEVFLGMTIEDVNNPDYIGLNDNLISINNALMLDLTGQVAAESIGTTQYSATGGQVNFVLGAKRSKGGKSIIALPSTYQDKQGNLRSRILPILPEGTIVSTSRNDVEWVATEYGAVRLTDRSISWRVKNIITLAHPDFRDELTFKAKKIGWI
jgi:4-hydroxybutyrate CoA-transferase